MTPEQEEALTRAQEALDEDRLEDALDELLKLPPQEPTRCTLEFELRVAAGELDEARRCHEELERYEHETSARRSGRLALAEWRIDDARTIFEELETDDPLLLEDLARCYELQGDLEHADRIFARAWELAPDLTAPRMTPEEFDSVITVAIRKLPPEHRAVMESIEVIVEPVPSLELLQGGHLDETPPTMLGLFTGASELERDPDLPEPPPRIFLFQRNLESSCHTREGLIEQIETTFMHELGHLLGFDEDGVAALGLE